MQVMNLTHGFSFTPIKIMCKFHIFVVNDIHIKIMVTEMQKIYWSFQITINFDLAEKLIEIFRYFLDT